MSLVFLKNRDIKYADETEESRPHYLWSNTFNTPLKLPPNSQVAYIQSTIALAKSLAITNENDVLYVVIGNPEINPTMRIPLPQGQPINIDAFMQVLNTQLNNWSMDSGFKTTEQTITGGNIVNQNGFNCVFDPLALKVNYACLQRKTNPLQFVGYNISKAGNLTGYNGTSQLGMYRINSPLGGTAWFPPFNVPSPAPSVQVANIGFNVIRMANGELLPGGGGSYDVINRVNSGTLDAATADRYAMFCSKTGIKKSGLALGVAGEFCEVIMQVRDNPGAYNPPVAGNECISHFAGLCPRYWLEADEFSTPGGRDPTRTEHLSRCDVNRNGGTARYLIGHRIDVDGGGAIGNVVAQVNTGSYENPDYIDVGQGVPLGGLATASANPPNHTTFKYIVKNSYQFALYVCRDYNQLTGDSSAGWTKVFDWEDGTNAGAVSLQTYLIPEWFGDLCLTCYCPYLGFACNVRGNFDLIQSFTGEETSPGTTDQPFPYSAYNSSIFNRQGAIRTSLPGAATAYFDGSIEGNAADGYAEKEMYFVHNPTNFDTDLDNTLQIPLFPIDDATGVIAPTYDYTDPLFWSNNKYFTISTPYTQLGYLLGFGSAANEQIDTGVPTPFQQYKTVATNSLQDAKNVNSIHIQLTNLPIQSKNAMIQDGVKDIAVVPCFNSQKVDDDPVNNLEIYHHQVGEKNWVDLNNIQSLYLNNLDVYLTYDDNKPATGIKEETDVLVMFRQKPASDLSTPLNIQTIPAQNPYQQTIQEI